MSNIAVRVENLGKMYRIGGKQERYSTFRDTLVDAVTSPFRKVRGLLRGESASDLREEIWALKDISFEVKHGEVVGIIGRNGAGKSTLLKILSCITEPTTGYAEVYGRVGALLEVGTGFHPELTGRENVYLNGAILGMSRRDIDRKFDEIVDFAGVEKFIDTPVKHYSSGMGLRLGFAVAAHLEPEILIVDEVLAVGDTAFQKKCLNKMQNVGQDGRTVLFVSHNMPAVTRLCPRTVLLERGAVLIDGPSYEVVGAYLRSDAGTTAERRWHNLEGAPGNEVVRLMSVSILDEFGNLQEAIDIRKPFEIKLEYTVLEAGYILTPNLHFSDEEGLKLFITADYSPEWRNRARPVGHYTSTVHIPGNLLSESTLIIDVAMSTMTPLRVHLMAREVVAVRIIDSLDGDSARGDYGGHIPGVIRPLLPWSNKFHPIGEESTHLEMDREKNR